MEFKNYSVRDLSYIRSRSRTFKYELSKVNEIPLLIDTLMSSRVDNVIINDFKYKKYDIILKLMNLKVLLNEEELFEGRLRIMEDCLKDNNWECVKESLNVINVPRDVELFILSLLIYKTTRGKYKTKVEKVKKYVYCSENDDNILEYINIIKQIFKKVQLKNRGSLRYSYNIYERIVRIEYSDYC